MQLYKYCPKWDKLINEAAEIGIIQFEKGSYRAIIERQKPEEDIGIWVVNHPYASFTNYPTKNQMLNYKPSERWRPSRATIIRLGKIYKQELKEANT